MDGTSSGHKGQGYQVQVMETFSHSEVNDEKQQRLNLIAHVPVQTACEHDSHALVTAIADTRAPRCRLPRNYWPTPYTAAKQMRRLPRWQRLN